MTDYRTVPVDPTEEMLHAADMKAMFTRGESDMPRALWSAMLAAAPALSASPAPAGDLVVVSLSALKALVQELAPDQGEPASSAFALACAIKADARAWGWQPIETAPTDETRVLLWGVSEGEISGRDDTPQVMVGARPYGTWRADPTDYYAVEIEPTHWMPLPARPGVGG